MQQRTLAIDPRYFQVIFQAIFLSYGILYLHWSAYWLHYIISIGDCLFFQYAADSIKSKRFLRLGEFNHWGFSVLILSAKESSGLKTWLNENGYKIHAGAEDVLEPYIKSNMKFFVVKVNEEATYTSIARSLKNKIKNGKGISFATLGVIGLATLAGFRSRKKPI